MQVARPRSSSVRSSRARSPSIACILLGMLLATLWVAGGASRGDELGQVVVRAIAWLLLLIAIVFGERPALRLAGPARWFLFLAIGLSLVQLIPLPPGLWQLLPGRSVVSEAALVSGQPQPWRPLSIVPGATLNAAASLIIPFTILVLATAMKPIERAYLPHMLLALIGSSLFIGLLQIIGAGFDNPFVNDTPGQISGVFANRNHFALFLSLGCLIAPIWALADSRQLVWRLPLGVGLTIWMVLTILATGSRAGLLLTVLALVMAAFHLRRHVKRVMTRYPRWVVFVLAGGFAAIAATFLAISVLANRAQSISRLFTDDVGQDMRARGLPIVLRMIREYFPFGTGLGSFDPMFRMHEPMSLLKLTYFNHVHNDFLEIVLDAGLPGLILLTTVVGWTAYAGFRAWRKASGRREAFDDQGLARLGASMLVLIYIASIFDYPARTPMIMAMLMIAGLWLGGRLSGDGGSALPDDSEHL